MTDNTAELMLLDVAELRKTHYVRRVGVNSAERERERLMFTESSESAAKVVAANSDIALRWSAHRIEAVIGGLTVTLLVTQGWGEPTTYMAVTKTNGKKKYEALRNYMLMGDRPDALGYKD